MYCNFCSAPEGDILEKEFLKVTFQSSEVLLKVDILNFRRYPEGDIPDFRSSPGEGIPDFIISPKGDIQDFRNDGKITISDFTVPL